MRSCNNNTRPSTIQHQILCLVCALTQNINSICVRFSHVLFLVLDAFYCFTFLFEIAILCECVCFSVFALCLPLMFVCFHLLFFVAVCFFFAYYKREDHIEFIGWRFVSFLSLLPRRLTSQRKNEMIFFYYLFDRQPIIVSVAKLFFPFCCQYR